MTETRDFPTEVIASITSGRLLCKFGDMHEAAEFLMGHPIWTHHFGSKPLWQDMQKTVLAQCPGMPVDLENESITPENVDQFVAKLHAELGPIVTIRKGGGLTAMLPTDGIPDHLKDETVFVKV